MANAASIEPHEGPAIEFDAVRIGFEEGDILRSVSFRVMPQETVVLLGETGTGKTLSLKLAAGLLQPNAGSVHVLGKNLGTMTERELLDFRRYFGPERRDILMLWRNSPKIHFAEHHAREPGGLKNVRTDLYCQHYGKSLSIDHWEETCDYYIKPFPFDTYGRKWTERKGKGIHTESDFQRPLYEWGDTLFAHAVKLER